MAILNKATLSSTIPNGEGGTVNVSTDSNTHRANNVDTDILVEKTSEQSWGIPESIIGLTTSITNNTDVDIENFTIQDTLGAGATFVEGSVKVGSTEYKSANILDGFTIPATLGGSGGSMDVTYQIKLDKYIDEDAITNNSSIGFQMDSKQFNLTSNEVSIQVLHNDISILKTADANAVKTGDIITYTITITNNGTLQNTNVRFSDPLPSEVQFVESSVKIDDMTYTGYNPNTGFNLNDINANDTVTIQFKATVL